MKNDLDNNKEEIVVNYIKKEGVITRKEDESLLGLSKTHVTRFLEQLIKDKIITKKGRNKSTRYILKG